MCLVYARHGVYIDMRQVGVEANNCARQCGAWVARQPEGGAMDVARDRSVHLALLAGGRLGFAKRMVGADLSDGQQT